MRGTRRAASRRRTRRGSRSRARRRARRCRRSSSAPSRTCTQKTSRGRGSSSTRLIATTCSSSRASSSTRVRRETLSPPLVGERRASSVPGAPARRAGRAARARSRRRRRARRRRRRPSRGSAPPRRRRAGRRARIGRSAARYSNTFPREHALAAAAGLGDQEQQRLGVALQLERAAARRVRDQLEPVAEPCASAHSRSVERKSPRKRATTSSSPTAASAVRNGRGSRLPKNEPACVIRNRSPRVVLEPGEVVEVGAVRDRHDRARAGRALAHLVGDRVGDA